ncbi:MAG: serine hydroxymethyltransferase [Chloroflexi bacterium]|nr:serine hydroxymethyltransferase [Chloroflexota bacterium]
MARYAPTGLAADPEVARAIAGEAARQRDSVVLIASENYASAAVLEAQGSILTNKYAEGYPGHRYYGGCSWVDQVESLAIERAKKLYGAEHANVQAHSGSQANMAAYFALLQPGDTVMGMSLAHGGHLTHGHGVNFSGNLYRFVHYGVSRETDLIDYDQVEKLAREHKPRLIVAGASAYPRVIDFEAFRDIAHAVNAYLMVDMAHLAGLVAANVHPSPVPYAQVITSTTHKTLRGPRGGFVLARPDVGAAVDKAMFPGLQGGPLMHVIAAKAVAFGEAMSPEFVRYQEAVVDNSRHLARELEAGGLRLVTGGTDNHMALVDLTPLNITGRQAEEALESVGIVLNRNLIPFDPRPPQHASGIRVGTPATTTRGFGPAEFSRVAQLMLRVLRHLNDDGLARQVKAETADLLHSFPVPGDPPGVASR